MKFTNLTDDARIAFDNIGDFASGLVTPTIRLGVTGLSRAGKTVFITSMVHNILHGGRLPLFAPMSEGRIARAKLEPQPDDNIARFRYEDHIETVLKERNWPQSTSQISQLRLTIEYESANFLSRNLGSGKLHVDIVDYPGEWLLDLPLLAKDYETWSKEAIALAYQPNRRHTANLWLEALNTTESNGEPNEQTAQKLAEKFTNYLIACRADDKALSMLPPGRFLMPGDLAGSPSVTFSPLKPPKDKNQRGTLWTLMERRYEAYKSIVVKPFFTNHFARLDRQVVLIDALQALNVGPAAIEDLEKALAEILACFRPGKNSWLSSILSRRIEKILFAATKADHLHHTQHAHLEAILKRLVTRATHRAEFAGAKVDSIALAAIRATREVTFEEDGEKILGIKGTPQEGETIDGHRFDGNTITGIFPGELNNEIETYFPNKNSNKEQITDSFSEEEKPLKFVRFRPPEIETTQEGFTLSLPHIRLDKTLDFLLADKLA